MSKEPPGFKPNYGSAIRVAQIIHWLHQHPFGISLAELRERLGISDRTLARYIQTLKETFYNEEGEALVEVIRTGSAGGRLRFKRKRFDMEGTAYELMSLYLALDLMAFLEGTFLLEGAQEVLDRLQQSLLSGHGHEAHLVLKDFHKKFFHWIEAPKDYSEHNALLSQLVKALILQKNIEMTYRSPGKPEKTHLISPLSLLMYKRGLYLIGRRRNAQGGTPEPGEITFAVERIRQLELMDSGFFYPTDYDPAHRFRNRFGLVTETKPEKVVLRFHPTVAENIASRRWHPSQQTRRLDSGEVILSFEIEMGVEFIAWILSYGSFVRVLEPESVRDRVVTALAKTLKQYQEPPPNR